MIRMMTTIIFILAMFFTLLLWKIFEESEEVSSTPLIKPSAYKVVVAEEENSDGIYETRYYPMEKTIGWTNIVKINNDHFDNVYTYSLQSAMHILKERQKKINNEMEILIEKE